MRPEGNGCNFRRHFPLHSQKNYRILIRISLESSFDKSNYDKWALGQVMASHLQAITETSADMYMCQHLSMTGDKSIEYGYKKINPTAI